MAKKYGWLWLTRGERQTVRQIRQLSDGDQEVIRRLVQAMCSASSLRR